MKATEKILLQGLILSLTTQLAISLIADNAASRSPSAASSSAASGQGIVGSLYRSAAIKANPEKDSGLAQSARGQRCVRCGQSGYYGGGGGGGGYTDRYYDDYYYRDRPQAGGYYGREDPYQRDPYYNQNRNWYPVQDYRQPAYDNRQPSYDRSYNRYDERYYGREDPYYAQREQQPYYDTRYNSNYNSYRGNGYDNLSPMYNEQRDRFQRDRGYGYEQYYDRFYDRPGYRASAAAAAVGGQYYDNRNFRPYDETYRGQAGFDNSGRGYYFASQQGRRPQPPPREPYPPTDPYNQAQKPPPSHLNHYNPPQTHSQYNTTPRVPPEFYGGKPSQSSSQVLQVSSNTIGTVDTNTSTNNKNSNKEIDDKEKASPTYGRPTLGSSYLFDRTEEDGKTGSEMSPPSAIIDDKKQESANMEMKSE